MDGTSELQRTVDDKKVEQLGAHQDSGMLAPVKDSGPAASNDNSAVAVVAPYCDDCMRIDSEPSGRYQAGWEIDVLHGGIHLEFFPDRVYILDACELEPQENGTASDHYVKKRRYPRSVDYQLIKKWLDDCGQYHSEHCFDGPSDLNLISGLQVIDCITRRIIPASEAVGTTYVTLSYVWGAPSGVTSEDVEEKSSVATLPNRLPRVVEDSIRVVKEFGFRYLWVDKYCIPQNDESAKHAQVRLMDRIYAPSAITVVAVAGDDGEYGLPGVGLRTRKPELRFEPVSVHTRDRHPRQLVMYLPPSDDINLSPWSTRAWAYQEALLSRRRLVFTDNQVFFQCQKMICEEIQVPSTRAGIVDSPSFAFPSPAAFFDSSTVWERIDKFSKRKLSFDWDALDALTGILNMYRSSSTQNSGVAFLCGLPVFPQPPIQKDGHTAAPISGKAKKKCKSFRKTSVLTAGLLWKGRWENPAISWPKAELSPTTLERPRRREFPSWTWAGWKSISQHALHVSPENNFDERYAWKCAIRAVYEGHERGLGWEEDAEQILKNSDLGLNPKFLDIKGTCFDVSLARCIMNSRVDGCPCFGWAYTTCKPLAFGLNGWRIENIPPNTLEEDEGKVHQLVALVFEKKPLHYIDRSYAMRCLLLQPVEYSAGRWVYERVTSCCVYLIEELSQWADMEEFEAALEERELR